MDKEDGGLSRRRQIRLDRALDAAVVAEAKRLHLRPSQIVRLALTSPFCLGQSAGTVPQVEPNAGIS